MAAASTGLSLLVDEQRVNAVLEQKSGARAFCKSGCLVLLFTIFLSLYTFLALAEPFVWTRTFEGYMRRRFDERATMPIHEVSSVSTFWRYMGHTFVPGIYGNDTEKYSYPGAVVPTFLPIDGQNRLLGVVRVRMLRVLPNANCEIAMKFTDFFTTCYGIYTEETEDKKDFGPVSSTGEAEFKWSSDLGGYPYAGSISKYAPGGFMRALTPRYNESIQDLQMLEDEDWIDESTRAVFLDFTIYNFNLGISAVCRILFEITPSGRWVSTFSVDVLLESHLKPLGFASTTDWLVLGSNAVLVLFVIGYLIEEASEFLGCESRGKSKVRVPTLKVSYFLDAWNMLDWLNLTLIIVTLGYRISTWSEASNLLVYTGDPSDAGVGTFTDYSNIADNVRNIKAIVAFNAVLTWFKAVKYINIFPYITIFMQTVTISQQKLFSFAIVFFTTLTGFVLGFSVAFGEQLSTFRTAWKAFVFLMRAFLGDANMEVVSSSSPFLGSVLIILFTIAMFFIIMNLYLAIMVSALSDAKQAEDMKQSKRYEQFLDRLTDFGKTVSTNLKLESKFRQVFPGLYSRMNNRKKKQEAKEKLRDDATRGREQSKELHNDLQALGPGSPDCGRKKARKLAVVAIEDGSGDEDEVSEADLGPFCSQEQLILASPDYDENGMPLTPGTTGMGFGYPDAAGAAGELTEDAIELVFRGTQHVADGIVERTHGARDVLFNEMNESKDVLHGVAAVLEVLGRRARDLEAQQGQLLAHF
mmetsp:Transcript_101223/g.287009  ORF Transcript_101223/g.287009 Transcript_101223/m.287009 type:complete len:753 (+) Transcript_101223:151-2409(+)